MTLEMGSRSTLWSDQFQVPSITPIPSIPEPLWSYRTGEGICSASFPLFSIGFGWFRGVFFFFSLLFFLPFFLLFFFILFFFSLLGNLLEYSSCLFASLCSKIESAPGTRAPPDNDMIPPAAAVVATTIIIINIITDYWDGPGWDNHTVASWPGLPRPFGSWVI